MSDDSNPPVAWMWEQAAAIIGGKLEWHTRAGTLAPIDGESVRVRNIRPLYLGPSK